MKPFNLQSALAGEKVITRDGRPVKIAGYNEEAVGYSKLAGWLEGTVECWSESGIYYDDKEESEYDLFMAPKKREVWVGYFEGANGNKAVVHAYSKKEIENMFIGFNSSRLITTVKIWEEEI